MRSLALLLGILAALADAAPQFQLPQHPTRAQIDQINTMLREAADDNQARPSVQGEVAFKKLGETSYRTEFVNVLLVEDYASIRQDAAYSRKALKMLEDNAAATMGRAKPSPSMRHTMQTAKTTLLRLEDHIDEFQLIHNPWRAPLPQPSPPSHERSKRGFFGDFAKSLFAELPLGNMAWWGIRTVGSSLFGWFSDSEADKAKEQAQANGRVLTEMRGITRALAANIDRDRDMIIALATSQADLGNRLRVDEFITAVTEDASRVQRRWDRFLSIYDAAITGTLSVQALSGRDISQIQDILARAAVARGLVIPINSGNDFLQCPISFTVTASRLEIVVHVPAAPESSLLQVFRYIPMPLPLVQGGVATPRLNDHIIAINPGQDRFAVLSAYDLVQCKSLGGLLYCPDLTSVRRPVPVNDDSHDLDEGLCLFSLITRNLDDALRRCPVTLSQSPDVVRQLGKGKFMIHTATDQEGQWECASNSLLAADLHFQIEAGRTIDVMVKEGCQGITKTHLFANPDNSRSTDWDHAAVFETPILEVPDELANSSLAELQAAAEKYLGQRDSITLEEALEAKQQILTQKSRNLERYVLMGVAGAVAFIFAIGFYYGAHKVCLRRLCASRPSQPPTPSAPLYPNLSKQQASGSQPKGPFQAI